MATSFGGTGYGNGRGLKACTHVVDFYSPFATQLIPVTASEAPYILDGLLMNETGNGIKEQYTDTGGFTDHVFAICSLLGFAFVPRIRDFPSKRLYAVDPGAVPENIKPLVGGKINARLIEQNWTDVLRLAVTMASGVHPPSQILRKLASYPRQHQLSATLREIGRLERTLFMIRWSLDKDLRCRAQVGLNKGEAHHALMRAICFHRRGEIRDRSSEGQHHRIAGLNLLTAIIIYWNNKRLSEAVERCREEGIFVDSRDMDHVSPLGWEHINLTGEYRWRNR